MIDTYIKLFRKLRTHEIMGDSTAIHIFIWILISVDYQTGSMKSGRFWGGEELNINPNTFYKALKRLEKKYDLVTLVSNNKNTIITVKKWEYYQGDGNSTGNNKVTTKYQQSNTNQEYKNKEYKNKYNTVASINKTTIEEIATQYKVDIKSVSTLAEELKLYCESKGRKYANYKAALQTWLRRRMSEGKIKVVIPTTWKPEYDEIIRNDVPKLLNKLNEGVYARSKN